MGEEADARADMIRRWQQIAQELKTGSVPRREFLRRTGLSQRKVLMLFGSYNALVEAAGGEPSIFPTADSPLYSDDDMLIEMARVLRSPDPKLTRLFFERNSSMSPSTVERRFGGWIAALRATVALLAPGSEGALIEKIEQYTAPSFATGEKREPPSRTNEQPSESADPDRGVERDGHESVPGASSNVYGDFINFRGLQHAPVNEQGVVFLFGMVCRELGYVVEIVRQGFPDCEAKRRMEEKPGMWQRVRIEFEYQSRTFRKHGHDPDQCDVIVCWEDNWPECPIEVTELRSILGGLSPEIPPG